MLYCTELWREHRSRGRVRFARLSEVDGGVRCEALAAVGKTVANSEAQLRACEFLLSKQCPDGGWGESYLSCQDKV